MKPCLAPLLAALGLSGLVACAPAPDTALPGQVVDPYANLGGGALYQGNLPGGALGGEASAEYFRSQIGDTVQFGANETTLGPQARATLSQQAQWLNRHQNFTAVIQGHAEETGTRDYNLALGARRASAVQEYLIAQGVAAARIRTLSFGKERPAAVCSDEACYAQNRRAVTVVSPAGAGT